MQKQTVKQRTTTGGLPPRNTVVRALVARRNAGAGKHLRSGSVTRQQARAQLRQGQTWGLE